MPQTREYYELQLELDLDIEAAEDTPAIYRRIRPKLIQIHKSMFPLLDPKFYYRSGHELGLLHSYALAVDSDAVPQMLADYCIYANPVRRRELIEDYWIQHERSIDRDRIELLNAMEEARYMLIHCESIVPRLGVQARDLLTDQAFLLLDFHLSESMTPGMLIAGHVIAPYGLHMTTGAPLPVADRDSAAEVSRIANSYAPKGGGPVDSSADGGLFAARVMRALIKRGIMQKVRYE